MRRLTDRVSAARRNDGGFTLIELLIVIIILGVLAAIVVFSVRGITNTGDEAACKSNFKTALTGIEAYYAQEDKYPADLETLVTDGFLAEDPSAADEEKVDVTYTNPAADQYTLASGTACELDAAAS